MIIHDIRIDDNVILVGATDEERWQWEMDDGARGGDAMTLVFVTLEDNGPGHTVTERMGLEVSREDPLRSVSVAVIPALFEAAWEIKKQAWTKHEAQEQLFGISVF